MAGALWYLFAIERADRCWLEEIEKQEWNHRYLYCGEDRTPDSVFSNLTLIASTLNASCPFIDPDEIKDSTNFDFGIFADALKSGIVDYDDFPTKIFYCFWWGLRNLRFVKTCNPFTPFLFISQAIFQDS